MELEKLIPQGKKKYLVILLLIIGIVFLLLGGVFSSTKTEEKEKGDDLSETIRYEKQLEERIENLCLSLSGIEKAEALVLLDCGTENRYASNSCSHTDEKSGELSVEYPSLSDALYLGETYPKIRGVAISVTGGEKSEVKKMIIELISASLGISSNRVAVGGSK